jgi:hypothetical protein
MDCKSTQVQQSNLNQKMKTKNMTTLHLRKSIHWSPLRRSFVLITLTFICSGLSRTAQAVTPAPDGIYPGLNTAEGGASALFSLTTGTKNTAVGVQALFSNTTGLENTATGYSALFSNDDGRANTATGFLALKSTRPIFPFGGGSLNTADGANALANNTIGVGNTAVGYNALSANATGTDNIGIGNGAGQSLTTGDFNIYIGDSGVANESSTTRIANIYSGMASVRAVYVNSDNKLGTLASTRRVKDYIKPMDKTSEVLLALKPVSFRYTKEIDPTRSLSFGLIAEEVAKLDPNLVTLDRDGKPETVRYEAVNAMLLNEFLKEHRKVEQLTKDFESKLAEQQKQIEALTAGLQKVSAQLEASKPAPQVVVSNQ